MKNWLIISMFSLCIIHFLSACSMQPTKTQATVKTPNNTKNDPTVSVSQTWEW